MPSSHLLYVVLHLILPRTCRTRDITHLLDIYVHRTGRLIGRKCFHRQHCIVEKKKLVTAILNPVQNIQATSLSHAQLTPQTVCLPEPVAAALDVSQSANSVQPKYR
jgi:hypothetical protein